VTTEAEQMTAATPVRLPGKRLPAIDHTTAMRLATTENHRFREHLTRLPADTWSQPTVCPAWDVHAMTCHVLGMTKMPSSIRENIRQMRIASAERKRVGGLLVDSLTALQVREHSHLSPAAIIDELATAGPAGAKGRSRTPGFVRRFVPAGEQPIDDTGSITELWSIGYLVDVILTRDTWMHRSDIAAATGIEMELTADHDGALIADVVEEWAGRHGQPCELTLTGPAGGSWSWGEGGPSLEYDAVEFCRVLSGRGTGDGLLTTRVPF
jgi:uncharacterized protein (TIGR03083 family)